MSAVAGPSAALAEFKTATTVDSRVLALRSNFAVFDRFTRRAEHLLATGDARSAAAYASIAAVFAVDNHCGVFSSPRLERLLATIGKQIDAPTAKARALPREVRRVLHVSSQVFPVGGHSKMIRLWIESDPGRRHSLVVTQQRGPIPDILAEAVRKQGGQVFGDLNRLPGGLFASVSALRRIARDYDIIVLHTGNDDVVPSIAFANTDRHPPVLFLNHADHIFWLGSSISQVVAGMRHAAMDLAETRRGIAKERSLLVPILVLPTVREKSRQQARISLGLAETDVLLISVARRDKYRSVGGSTYADVHAETIRKHPNARIVVVGAGDQPDWERASRSVGGRIAALTPQDPKPYFEAADIYLDSYPFCSATSMMEAAGYGLPCITRFLLPAGARICGMDHPGLFGPLIEVDNNRDYQERLSELIRDGALRARLGAAMQASVADANVPPGWLRYMEAAYAAACNLPRPEGCASFAAEDVEQPFLGEPDLRIEEVYGRKYSLDLLLKDRLGQFSISERVRVWNRLRRDKALESGKEHFWRLLPDWLIRRLKDAS